jgi:putative DNA primase/helicase
MPNQKLPPHFSEAAATYRAERDQREPLSVSEQNGSDGWDAKAVGKLLQGDTDRVIAELAALRKVAYEQKRKKAAKDLGIRTRVLDELIEDKRSTRRVDAIPPHWSVEPWPEAVNGAALLNEIRTVLSRHIVLPPHAAEAISLWVMHSWCLDVADISPFLVLSSPVKRCGKTNLLILLRWLTCRSELASNITPAAMFRYIETHHPSLLIDEGDSFISGNDELRGILNSGHTRAAAYVIRCDGRDNVPRRFSTWAPKAIALIGKLPDTIEDRSILIRIKRRRQDEAVARLRSRDAAEYAVIRRKALRWAAGHQAALAGADPTEIASLNDRAMDNWRPLLAIAEVAGGNWLDRAIKAAIALSADECAAEESLRVELLKDIRCAFAAAGTAELTTRALIEALTADAERPWADFRRGKPITPKQLGSLLRSFAIVSQTVRPAGGPDAKGYKLVHFEDALTRYSGVGGGDGRF